MDSIFEEDADEVGGEIEAYCPSPRCKADTTHTIISMYEDEVRRVQCVVCGEVHAYRKPRGDGVEGEGEGAGKKGGIKRLSWDEALGRATDADLANCRPFSIRDTYEEGDVVHHPVFDVGFVVEQLPDNKVEVIFRDGGSRILVHNRGDLAARMPDIAEIPVPREAKKKKRAKKTDTPAVALPQRSKAEVEAAVLKARAAHRRAWTRPSAPPTSATRSSRPRSRRARARRLRQARRQAGQGCRYEEARQGRRQAGEEARRGEKSPGEEARCEETGEEARRGEKSPGEEAGEEEKEVAATSAARCSSPGTAAAR